MKELICIECPKGCHITVDDELNVTGNTCLRGKKYALNEVSHPMRMVTSTVKIESELVNRCPVITEQEVPKEKMFDVVEALNHICIKAPVKVHDVICENVCGLQVNILATRSIEK